MLDGRQEKGVHSAMSLSLTVTVYEDIDPMYAQTVRMYAETVTVCGQTVRIYEETVTMCGQTVRMYAPIDQEHAIKTGETRCVFLFALNAPPLPRVPASPRLRVFPPRPHPSSGLRTPIPGLAMTWV